MASAQHASENGIAFNTCQLWEHLNCGVWFSIRDLQNASTVCSITKCRWERTNLRKTVFNNWNGLGNGISIALLLKGDFVSFKIGPFVWLVRLNGGPIIRNRLYYQAIILLILLSNNIFNIMHLLRSVVCWIKCFDYKFRCGLTYRLQQKIRLVN